MGSPVRLSLIRKHTWMGGDRQVVGLSILIAVLLGWMLTNAYGILYGIPVAVAVWIPGVWAGQEMYKADPYAFAIWQRHNKDRRYYAARAHYAEELPVVKDFI